MLVNELLANKQVATQFGQITFNEKGECKDLKPEQEKVLGKLPNFHIVEEKPKKETKVKEVKEEPKEKKTPPKKKKTTKKEEK
ncbi:Phage protein [Bacillus licheniformis]|nr:Phage protein [Bacillus licheniformis]